MSIQEVSTKFKGFISNPEYMLTILIIAVSCVSFYLGRVSVMNEDGALEPSTATVVQSQPILMPETVQSEGIPTTSLSPSTPPSVLVGAEQGKYVASKKGTKYHLPWCGGAKQITEANKIWFVSKEDAEKAGYTPASNCKGI